MTIKHYTPDIGRLDAMLRKNYTALDDDNLVAVAVSILILAEVIMNCAAHSQFEVLTDDRQDPKT